ncbi:uncharacterized protein Dwil_GK14836 [Drosophila willistoni]|uniref:Uncharacterized protein n=2 Tax=Drosophila willistoni TaxID=7260 RepID=B4MWI0_DROWI|nr:uncharacterized protein Dwil_GK14836 [Drosophila willistoni]
MLGLTRSVSAPDFSQWYHYKTHGHEEELERSSSQSHGGSQIQKEISFDSPRSSIALSYQPRQQATAETQTPRLPTGFKSPSFLEFLCYVYLITGIQVLLAVLQWLATTYEWQPKFNSAERILFAVILLLTWSNLSLGFLGFRRLQLKFPLNWIVFVCIFESLTLLIMLLSVRELDLTWPFMIVGVLVFVIYTVLGLWVPSLLSADLWILIFASISVLGVAIIAMSIGLAVRFYIPLSVCMIIFGPWAMYNSQNVNRVKRMGYCNRSYLVAAVKMYINFACTVGATVLVYRVAVESVEDEACKNTVICSKRSFHPFNI